MKALHTDTREAHLFAQLIEETTKHAPPGEKVVNFSLIAFKGHDNEKGLWFMHQRFGLANNRGMFAIYSNYGTIELNIFYIKINLS